MSPDQLDQLLSSVVDSCDEPTWRTFVMQAESQPGLWRELAEMQRDHSLLSHAVAHAAAVASQVELPETEDASSGEAVVVGGEKARRSSPSNVPIYVRVAGGLGWAAAAALALALVLGRGHPGDVADPHQSARGSQPDTSLVRIDSPDDAVREYVLRGRESGQVVGEMPTKLLIDSRPSSTGEGFDVVYLRQFMERGHVPALYQPSGRDETGHATLVNYEPQRGSAM